MLGLPRGLRARRRESGFGASSHANPTARRGHHGPVPSGPWFPARGLYALWARSRLMPRPLSNASAAANSTAATSVPVNGSLPFAAADAGRAWVADAGVVLVVDGL